LTKKQPWFILVSELTMTETKSPDPDAVPEPADPAGRHSSAANDPNQTRLLPVNAVLGKHDIADSHGDESGSLQGMAEEPKPMLTPSLRFKKLSQSQIIWISLSIIMTFLLVFFWLIMQGRPKNKMLKPAAGEPVEEATETAGVDASGILKKRLAPQAIQSDLLLTDDEFAGQVPMAVKASGPVISAVVDPELAAMVDALKVRLKIFVDSKSVSRGNIITRVCKGDFRGFIINVEEKVENQITFSEEVTVSTPKKGFIKTVNGVLESIKGSDLARFSAELLAAGLESIKLPLQPGDKVFRVQLEVVNVFGKPVAGDLLISGKSVGKISLGMSTAQLETMLLSSYIVLKRKVLVNDIYCDVYKILDQSNEPLFFIYENKGQVGGISIISEFFKTEQGIGIGSSFGDLRVNYPRVNMGISDKKTPYVKIDGVDGLFVMQGEGVDIRRHILPNKTKVISILIGNSLEFE
jgi:hypothetical protein